MVGTGGMAIVWAGPDGGVVIGTRVGVAGATTAPRGCGVWISTESGRIPTMEPA
jgi:hypothetical protein